MSLDSPICSYYVPNVLSAARAPSRGVLMAGQDAALAGVVRSCTPGRTLGQNLTGYRAGRSGHRETRERTDAAWRADWRVLPKVQRLLGAPHPRMEGGEKRRAFPRPSQVRDRQSVGFFCGLFDRCEEVRWARALSPPVVPANVGTHNHRAIQMLGAS